LCAALFRALLLSIAGRISCFLARSSCALCESN
jgi:hypothetical protein